MLILTPTRITHVESDQGEGWGLGKDCRGNGVMKYEKEAYVWVGLEDIMERGVRRCIYSGHWR